MKLRLTIILFAAFVFCQSCQGQTNQYRCPPCGFNCHHTLYDAPGTCPTCQMTLIPISDSKIKGYHKSEVQFKNDEIVLNGVYYTPYATEAIKGAVVIVHGSAPSTHEDVFFYTKMASELGFAVLAYDKRGVGKSQGTYEYFSVSRSVDWFNLLADDVVAAIDWLKRQPELIDSKVGLIGGSQAGWIMPLAAHKSNQVDFMIIGEGVSISAGEEAYFSNLTGDGVADGIPISEADQKLKDFDGFTGFDPRKILEDQQIKTLWFFGTNDPVIPVNASVQALENFSNPNHTIQILPHGDHNFLNTKTGERYDLTTFIRPWLVSIGVYH